MKCTKAVAVSAIVAAIALPGSAEITHKFQSSSLAVNLKNETSLPWTLGGIRFQNNGFEWQRVDNGYYNCQIINTPVGTKNQVTLSFNERSPLSDAKLSIGKIKPFNHTWISNTTGAALDSSFTPEILLKTGNAGTIDPISTHTPPAITLDQLNSLVANPNFYATEYRYSYVDSLGVNGGPYSGGFTDTWNNNGVAETQMQIAYPTDTFTLNNFGINIDTSVTKGPMYWMSLAMGQEYFSVDLQWMMTMGIKEGNAGVKKQHTPNDVEYDGSLNHTAGYGAWHTEGATGVDRALTYPHFFPRFASELSNARDIPALIGNSNIKTVYDLLDYYCGNTTEINSAQILNTMIISIITQYTNYDVFASSSDICWKEALSTAVDPYMGLGAMCVVYNQGNSNVKAIARDLNSTNYETTCQMKDAHLLWGPGQNNYIPSMLVGVQNFVEASRLSQSDPSVEILDHPITERELLDLFFGDNGTVLNQGPGGLMRHYYDETVSNCSKERQAIWTTLTDAFDVLKGKSPSTQGTDAISLRYDFLSIIRTVKEYFPFDRKVPSGGDAVNIIIPANSGNYPSCNESITTDSLYPHSEIIDTSLVDQISMRVRALDNASIKDVRWSVDPNWNIWHNAQYVSGPQTNQIFSIALPTDKFDVKDGPVTLWYMVRDDNYNSVVRKVILNDKVEIQPTGKTGNNLKAIQIKSSSNKIHLSGFSHAEQMKVDLFKVNGQLVQTLCNRKVEKADNISVSTSPLLTGNYILTITTPTKSISRKVSIIK